MLGIQIRIYNVDAIKSLHDECYMRMALRTTFVSCVALVLPRGFKNDECYMRMAYGDGWRRIFHV